MTERQPNRKSKIQNRKCLHWLSGWALAAALLAGVSGCSAGQPASSASRNADDGLKRAGGSAPTGKLSRALLDESLALGRQFLLNNQRDNGSFVYLYDFVYRRTSEADNQVRQAGALWGVALIHQDHPTDDTAKAVRGGLAFFRANSRVRRAGGRYIVYPVQFIGKTGTIALLVLAHVELLRTELPDETRAKLQADLDEYLALLVSLRRDDGHFWGQFKPMDGSGFSDPSPYFDGEALLAMVKAARYAGHEELKPVILASADAMYDAYVTRALAIDRDSDLTKGFYQWSSMAFYELHASKWEGTSKYAKYAIDLGHWMIDTHEVLRRTRNTGYAFEGLCSAWELARLTGDEQAREKFGQAIEQGMTALTAWQVGSPLANAYIRAHPTTDKKAVGGVMNADDEPSLRIDVTQHQMHAVILARRFIYKE